jgi:RHS repeat-associated protein
MALKEYYLPDILGSVVALTDVNGAGLYFYRARYYNPDLKRFIAQDPIGLAGGDTNFQDYVGNDPVNNTDPSGECIEDFCIDEAVT